MDQKNVPDYDYLLKLIVVGNSGVGKSSLVHRFTHHKFNPHFVSTIGVDFEIREFQVNDKKIKLSVWDTSGSERFRTITTSYYRGSHGIMLVFDVQDITSIEAIPSWIAEIHKYNETGKILLVGNKHDDPTRNFAFPPNIQDCVDKHGLSLILTSAKTNTQVDDAFRQVCAEHIQERMAYPCEPNKPTTVVICPGPDPTFSFSKCCYTS